jgi:hypothetical protein
MQVYNPPFIPPIPPTKWYETARFWGGIGLCIAFFALGFAMTGRVMLAHIFFFLAWPSGSFALWFPCNGIFRRKKLAWILTSLLLGIILAATDYVALHP